MAVGDSITWGLGSENPGIGAWPARLERLINNNSPVKKEVINYGLWGATVMKNSDFPYWQDPHYEESLKSEADIVLM